MVDTEVVAGLALGYLGGQFLGNFVEDKLKPGIVATSTNQDKMIAGAYNDGPKLALAYGAYKLAQTQTSPFVKNVAWGSILAAVIDAGWRYSHSGVPYGYKPFNIPLLGDLNEIIAGPNSGSANGQEHLALPAPPMSPAKKQAMCNSIKTDAITKNRSYTAQEMEMCTGLLNLQGYTTPVPGTSPGDITPSPTVDPTAQVQDEDPVSTIPDRKGRFAFMEDKMAKHFGFTLGSPISEREKYFGMKT